jgi:DNA repair protein RecO (recombination protein O)
MSPLPGRTKAAPLAAFMLHRYDWSETSLIIELFTRELGRVTVAAKGAKRPTSQLRAVLLPFQRIQVTLGRSASKDDGASDIHNLRGAEWGGGVPQVRGEALFTGFYLNELLMKLLAREDPHPLLWDAYAATLAALGQANEAAALRAFELVLLQEAGFLPALHLLAPSHAPLPDNAMLVLRPEMGLQIAGKQDEHAVASAVWLQLHDALDQGDIAGLQRACAGVEPALRRQLRGLLHYHLHTPQLKSRTVWRELQPFLQAPP